MARSGLWRDEVDDGRAGRDESGGRAPGKRTRTEGLLERMEQSFGCSFEGVKLRDDDAAADRAAALGARAYTDGNEIGFARGEFAPGTRDGDFTIAHELAHVAQARGGTGWGGSVRLRAASADGAASSWAEAEADAAAADVIAGRRPTLAPASFGIARKDRDDPHAGKRSGRIAIIPDRSRHFVGEKVRLVVAWNDGDEASAACHARARNADWSWSVDRDRRPHDTTPALVDVYAPSRGASRSTSS